MIQTYVWFPVALQEEAETEGEQEEGEPGEAADTGAEEGATADAGAKHEVPSIMIQQAEEEEEEDDEEEEEEQEEEEHVGSPEGKSASEVGKVHLHNKEFFTPGMLYRK